MELSWNDVDLRARKLAAKLRDKVDSVRAYGVPRGGIYAAMALRWAAQALGFDCTLVNKPESANVIVDDLIDSGATKLKFQRYGVPFVALVDKKAEGINEWVIFPWETMQGETGPEDCVRRLIEFVGDDPNREGLRETPSRVIRAYRELFAGYKQKPEDVVKLFVDGLHI